MSSLLSTASVWEPTENTVVKKRASTLNTANSIRKTVKHRAREMEGDEYDRNSSAPMTIAELQHNNAQKQTRVNDMLNHITSVNTQNAGSNLSDFVPLAKSDMLDSGNQLLPKTSTTPSSGPAVRGASGNIYAPNESSLGKYGNYRSVHDPTNLLRAPASGATPYYAKMGIGKNEGNDRMMEKINYMIRMLEEQQLEKTNHITEEFILYSLLGVFVIYVVDSFSRAGKYMR